MVLGFPTMRHAAQGSRHFAATCRSVPKSSKLAARCMTRQVSQFPLGKENAWAALGTTKSQSESRDSVQDMEVMSKTTSLSPKTEKTMIYEGGYLVPTSIGLSDIICNSKQKIKARRVEVDLPAGYVVREQFYGWKELRTYNNTQELEAGIKELGMEFVAHNCFSPPPSIVMEKTSSHLLPTTVLLNVPADFSNHGKEGVCQANVRNVYLSDRKLFVTTRPVKAGDELFNDYTDYSTVSWFENYLNKQGEISIRQFGHKFEDSNKPPPRSSVPLGMVAAATTMTQAEQLMSRSTILPRAMSRTMMGIVQATRAMSQTSIPKFGGLQGVDSKTAPPGSPHFQSQLDTPLVQVGLDVDGHDLTYLHLTRENSKMDLSRSKHYSSLLDTFRLTMMQNECGKIDIAVLQDPDTLRFLTGLSGVLGMSYGRPTLLIVPAGGAAPCTLLTPVCEANMARRNVHTLRQNISRNYPDLSQCALAGLVVVEWGDDEGWEQQLESIFSNSLQACTDVERSPGGLVVGIETLRTHPAVNAALTRGSHGGNVKEVSMHLDYLRQVKIENDLVSMRKAGSVAVAALASFRQRLTDCVSGKPVAEWEAALAAVTGAAKQSAEFMETDGSNCSVAQRPLLMGESPVCTMDGAPIVQSACAGDCGEEFVCVSSPPKNFEQMEISNMDCVHSRAGLRKIQDGDVVYFCCCNFAEYRGMHVGFDRTFFVGGADKAFAKTSGLKELHDVCLASQQAALDAIHPGAICEDVHRASLAVLQANGVSTSYRSGRAIGYSSLETPEFKIGDKTVLRPGMCFAVDGAASKTGVGTVRIGDSIVVTENGYEYLTPYEKGPISV